MTRGITKTQTVKGSPKKINIIAANNIINWKVNSLNTIPKNVELREDITPAFTNSLQLISSPGL